MEKLGTNYGGWYLPKDIFLTKDSNLLLCGAGEDISFDLILSDNFDCNIYIIDPTDRALKHFEEIKNYYKNKEINFSGEIQKDYIDKIEDLKPNFNKIRFIEKGILDKEDELKFYKQKNTNYVSQSFEPEMFGSEFNIKKVDTISNIMKENNIDKIDLLKLDIEGSEIKVLKQMIREKIFPKFLLVEFDLHLKKKDKNNETQELLNELEKYYNILINDKYNITYKIKVNKFLYIGRPDGIGNRIEELIRIQNYCLENNIECDYFWNNKLKSRNYDILINFDKINIVNFKNDSKIINKIENKIEKEKIKFKFCFNLDDEKEFDVIIHIRGKDRLNSKNHKDFSNKEELENFINRTIDYINFDKNIETYTIVTDDATYIKYIKEKIKKTFVKLENSLKIPKEWLDFYYLTKTKKYIFMCCKFSSYSITASLLGKKKLIVFPESLESNLPRYNADLKIIEPSIEWKLFLKNGLFNRIFPLICILYYSKDKNINIKIFWKKVIGRMNLKINEEKEKIYDFTDIFEKTPHLNFTDKFNSPTIKYFQTDEKHNCRIKSFYQLVDFENKKCIERKKGEKYYGNLDIETNNNYIKNIRKFYKKEFILNKNIIKIANTISIPESCTGIHIRITDGDFVKKFKENSEKVFKILEENLEKGKVFLSTDSKEIHNKYKNHKNIILYNNENKFLNNSYGTYLSVIDCLLLSKCSKLYLTRYSSFGFFSWFNSDLDTFQYLF